MTEKTTSAAQPTPETKTEAKAAPLFEIKSICGERVHHPYVGVWFEADAWSKPLPMDSWIDLQVKGGKLKTREARD